jgi:hypothetical protein
MEVACFPNVKIVSEHTVSHRKGLIFRVVSSNRVCRESGLRERLVTYRTMWEISVAVSVLILPTSSFSKENILPGRNFYIRGNVTFFLLFVIFKAFAYFNGAKKRKKYFYYFFRKHVIILLNYHCRSLEKIGVRHLIFVLN